VHQQFADMLAEKNDAKAERDAGALGTFLHKDLGLRADFATRVRESARQPRGIRDLVALRSGADRFPGATYSIFVPTGYDPLTPLPLVVALHDGGKGGKDGTAVVGSGKDATTLYLDGAQERGWILVAPTAIVAPWTAKENEPFIMALLDEVIATWAVDLDRVFLVGHGMGGDGTAAIGARHLDRFAGIACSSSTAGGNALKAAKGAGTAVFLYHADDDPAVAVSGTRAVADALLASDADFVYLELPGQGHGFAGEASRELYAFFRVKRLSDSRRATDWPRSSLLR
jgi:poly(3-hydroxybutyrate) depolymerase